MGFEPEWEEWAYRVSAEIWEAVTLAHDVEPSRLPVEWRPLDDSDPFEEWPQLARDIRIATDHAGRKLKCVDFAGNPARHKVDLSDFVEWWTESLGRKLPVRFPRTELTATLRRTYGRRRSQKSITLSQRCMTRPKHRRRKHPTSTKWWRRCSANCENKGCRRANRQYRSWLRTPNMLSADEREGQH